MLEAAHRSAGAGVEDAACFLPLVEIGSMRHARLHTRLFIS
jgi:urease accessory protein UreF